MLHLPKKTVFPLILLVFAFLPFLISVQSVSATPQYTKPQDVFNPSIDQLIEEKKTLEELGKKEAQISSLPVTERHLHELIFGMTGLISCVDLELCGNKPTALGTMADLVGTLYKNPPASGLAYTRNVLQNAGLLAKPAYAQGIGFAGLIPILPLWNMAKNISYAVLIIVMIAIGFMIIFRMKIDPKTVVSIQAALPKIIITLLLITFSYPIAGFLIDVMYLSMGIIIQVMVEAVPKDILIGAEFNTAKLQEQFMGNPVLLPSGLFSAVFNLGMLPSLLINLFGSTWGNVIGGGGIIVGLAGILRMFAFAAFWKALLVGFGGIVGILLLILVLGLLFTFIRIFLLLFNSYMQLLLTICLAPILLLEEAIPGRSAFAQWIQNIIANLIVFPATAAIIMFSWILTSVAWKQNLWAPPMLPSGAGGGEPLPGNTLAAFIGLGMIFMTPNLVASVKKAFHPKATIPVTAGSPFAPLTGGAQTAMGAASQFYYLQMTLQNTPGLSKIFGAKSGGSGPQH